MSRFVVGIDLGTTNCAVAYIDCEQEEEGATAAPAIQLFAIPQVVAPGEVAARSTLPSFLLLPTEHEVPLAGLALPWDEQPRAVVGTLARDRGAELPHRLVSSAKSWLSHTGVDRSAAILPWRGSEGPEPGKEEGQRVSPVQASARYLAHIRAAWNAGMPAPLEEQEVLLTVPASFDAVARELTVSAARSAGLPKVTLLEEPQAAFYSWLAAAGDAWRQRLGAGDVVLVCDIGGGTTDFSLIAVGDVAGNLELERVAVGEHILLGGDNMDLALAHAVTQKLAQDGKQLKPMQQRALVHACRRAKEQLLGPEAPESVPIAILGSGSRLIGGTLRSELGRAEVQSLLVDGFFPAVTADARPQKRRALGLRELGLPYASDPAVTRHLAEFLARHGRQPTAILWNGGVMKGELLRRRVAETVGSWHSSQELRTLEEAELPGQEGGARLELAVAHGAAYYGMVRRGRGIRIRGGTARSYYIGVETAMPAIPGFAPPVKGLCVAPFGMEEGTSVDLPEVELVLLVGEPTTFRFFASTSRKEDGAGVVVDPDEAQLEELASVEANLPADERHPVGEVVPVALSAHVTEVGTLELWCAARDGQQRWKLEYSLREHDRP